ncbi:hypothetical protein CRUP_036561 [Coryphaenoides rupestris]|nr:hypothetical protein CRUP_036561 [Coryphaenoides rupestris]
MQPFTFRVTVFRKAISKVSRVDHPIRTGHRGHLCSRPPEEMPRSYTPPVPSAARRTTASPRVRVASAPKRSSAERYFVDAGSAGGSDMAIFCLLCGKRFQTQPALQQHMEVHAGVRSYICSECNRTFPSHTALKRHLRSHTGRGEGEEGGREGAAGGREGGGEDYKVILCGPHTH